MAGDNEVTGGSNSADGAKQKSAKPAKVLPTDRVGFEKQLGVLRGFAAASGAERKPVSNRDVGQIVQMHENTISICNPFFADAQLVVKEGQKQRPTDDVFNYQNAHGWDAEKAAQKLAPTLRKAWFATTLIPKLTFRSLSVDEAVAFLAEEAKASKDYKTQLELLIDYLRAAGIVTSDGSTVSLGPLARESVDGNPNPLAALAASAPAIAAATRPVAPTIDEANVERFIIPIPGKESATIMVPKDLSSDDWGMLKVMLEAYIARLQKSQASD